MRISLPDRDSWVLPNSEKLVILPEQNQFGLSDAVLSSAEVTRPICGLTNPRAVVA